MDFYGFYFGKLTQLDEISPFFDNKKKTFTMKENTEPFSLESDNAAVQAQNNFIFLNGVYQAWRCISLTGSIIEFSEAPRAGSDCILYIYTGSASDILISNTFNLLIQKIEFRLLVKVQIVVSQLSQVRLLLIVTNLQD